MKTRTILTVAVLAVFSVLCVIIFSADNSTAQEQLMKEFNRERGENVITEIPVIQQLSDNRYVCVAVTAEKKLEVIYVKSDENGFLRKSSGEITFDEALKKNKVFAIETEEKGKKLRFGFTENTDTPTFSYKKNDILVYIIDVTNISELNYIGFWYLSD